MSNPQSSPFWGGGAWGGGGSTTLIRNRSHRLVPRGTRRLTWGAVCDTPTLPPLCALKIDKALQNDRLAQNMRITLANPRGYVALRAGGMGEIERPREFQGQHNSAAMNPEDLFAWHTWTRFHQSQTAYARRYMGAGSTSVAAPQSPKYPNSTISKPVLTTHSCRARTWYGTAILRNDGWHCR